MEEDGLYRPAIKRHSLEKHRRHNFYAALFSKAMHWRWKHRVYIGLYAGAGRAIVQPGGELVETSALAVMRQEFPFTKYTSSTPIRAASTPCVPASRRSPRNTTSR